MPNPLIMFQNFCPVPAIFSRRRETVNSPGFEASIACLNMSGEGYPAVPRNRRDDSVISSIIRDCFFIYPPCIGATISISSSSLREISI